MMKNRHKTSKNQKKKKKKKKQAAEIEDVMVSLRAII